MHAERLHWNAKQCYRTALENYAMAEASYVQSSQYDVLTNLYFSVGLTHHHLSEDAEACAYFTKSLDAAQKNRELHPDKAPSKVMISNHVDSGRSLAHCAVERSE